MCPITPGLSNRKLSLNLELGYKDKRSTWLQWSCAVNLLMSIWHRRDFYVRTLPKGFRGQGATCKARGPLISAPPSVSRVTIQRDLPLSPVLSCGVARFTEGSPSPVYRKWHFLLLEETAFSFSVGKRGLYHTRRVWSNAYSFFPSEHPLGCWRKRRMMSSQNAI